MADDGGRAGEGRAVGPAVVGRDAELARIESFVHGSGARVLFVTGPAGAGKTTLWEEAVRRASTRRVRVLLARPAETEITLDFSVLSDLLERVEPARLAGVPAPQAQALEVALLRRSPGARPPEQRAVCAGLVNVLRALAAAGPLLVAVDDLQWCDARTARALGFAVRRLGGEDIRFLCSVRSGPASELERALGGSSADRLELGPLSVGAIRRILFERLGLSPTRRLLRRLYEHSLGNPLLALELARALAGREVEAGEGQLPIPAIIEDLLGVRVGELSEPARALLLAVALEPELRAEQLGSVVSKAQLEAAVEAGLVVVDGARVRAAHPLLAAAVRARCTGSETRAMHLLLADLVEGHEARVRHLLCGTERPDEELRAAVSAAAANAAARGAVETAIELAERALTLTPKEAPERPERLLALAAELVVAGELKRASALLSSELDALPPGPLRARAHLLLFDGGDIVSLSDAERHLDLALADSEGDADLKASVLARKAECAALVEVERLDEAEGWVEQALALGEGLGRATQRLVLHELAWLRILRGRPLDEVRKRWGSDPHDAVEIGFSLERVEGVRRAWRGDIHGARALFGHLLALAEERGEGVSLALLWLQSCELELRAGDWAAAERALEQIDPGVIVGPCRERCRALIAAGRGLAGEAGRWAERAMTGARACGIRWELLEARRARGMAALLAGEPAAAAGDLGAVWEHLQGAGVSDPGAFPAGPDLVEALVQLGELDRAAAVSARLGALAEETAHPWGRASAARCRALVALARGDGEAGALAALSGAAGAYRAAGLAFDRARTLLASGRAQRQRKRWSGARADLERAAEAFEEIGSDGWAALARAELARVGGRRAHAPGELTPAERQTAELAARGLSNKEIAARLFVTVRTVESHLSSAYGKLGVRSRVELARRLPAG